MAAGSSCVRGPVTNSDSGFPRIAPMLHGRPARPAPEGAIEGADLGVAEQEGYLGERVAGILQVLDREAVSCLAYQGIEIRAILLEPTLQRARTDGEFLCDGLEFAVPVAHALGDRFAD